MGQVLGGLELTMNVNVWTKIAQLIDTLVLHDLLPERYSEMALIASPFFGLKINGTFDIDLDQNKVLQCLKPAMKHVPGGEKVGNMALEASGN